MRTIPIKSFWPFHYDAPDPGVNRDADRLMLVYGDRAYETAGAYSWREDTGLLYTHSPGHWHRVRLEIRNRIGVHKAADAKLPLDVHHHFEGYSQTV